MGNLTVNQVKAIVKDQKTGRHADGDGFYLMIPRVGRPYWMLRYTLFKKRKEVTIGKVDELSLADARLKASELRKQISEGINPIAERKRSKQADIQIIDDSSSKTGTRICPKGSSTPIYLSVSTRKKSLRKLVNTR